VWQLWVRRKSSGVAHTPQVHPSSNKVVVDTLNNLCDNCGLRLKRRTSFLPNKMRHEWFVAQITGPRLTGCGWRRLWGFAAGGTPVQVGNTEK
jgi:hypothetical protein